MRKLAFIAFIFLSCAGLAAAQIPTSGNVFVGYSFENSSSSTLNQDLSRPNLQGWEASLEGKIIPFLGVVADLSGHYGPQSATIPPPTAPCLRPSPAMKPKLLFGPRVSVSLGKFRPFAEADVGVARVNTDNGFGPRYFVRHRVRRRIWTTAFSVLWPGGFREITSAPASSTQPRATSALSTGIVFRF